MYYSGLTNSQRSDTDPGFKVRIQGISRAKWSLVLDHLQQWSQQNANAAEKEILAAIDTVARGIESHLVANSDGYTLSATSEAPLSSESEIRALIACRARHAEKLAEMEKHAMELELHLLEKKRKREKLSSEQKQFLKSRC